MGDITLREAQKQNYKRFNGLFGLTPLSLRKEDLLNEVRELADAKSILGLREEAGDTLASLLALMSECGWDAQELLEENTTKIEGREKQYRSSGRKIKVAIYGGSFDPITLGHIKSGQLVLNFSNKYDEVWFTPCFGHMDGKKLESAQHRLAMCDIATQVDGRFKVFPYEIENQLDGQTFHFVQRLMNEDFAKNQYSFSFIIGQDVANVFHRWVNFEHLNGWVPFVVIPRVGVEPAPDVDWYLKPPNVYLAGSSKLAKEFFGDEEISSTLVRRLIAERSPEILRYIDPNVWDYIKEHKLYGINPLTVD